MARVQNVKSTKSRQNFKIFKTFFLNLNAVSLIFKLCIFYYRLIAVSRYLKSATLVRCEKSANAERGEL